MSLNTSIQFLTRMQINIAKWDNCIDKASNGLIYSFSFYLDALCDNWDAFVFGDYEAVMPLPWRKKIGIKYLYAPPFVQQLGITGNHGIINNVELFQKIKKLFLYGDIFFNYSHSLSAPTPIKKTNFIINLNQPYNELALHYSNVLKKNLKTASRTEFTISTNISHQIIIEIFQNKYQKRIHNVNKADFRNFSNLCDLLLSQNMLETRTIENKEKEILATVLLLKDKKRIYNIINSITAVGRKVMANHVLFNKILKEFSETNILFDFEGSDLPGVKEFYEYFGPVNQPYFHFHYNNLPFPLNLIKK